MNIENLNILSNLNDSVIEVKEANGPVNTHIYAVSEVIDLASDTDGAEDNIGNEENVEICSVGMDNDHLDMCNTSFEQIGEGIDTTIADPAISVIPALSQDIPLVQQPLLIENCTVKEQEKEPSVSVNDQISAQLHGCHDSTLPQQVEHPEKRLRKSDDISKKKDDDLFIQHNDSEISRKQQLHDCFVQIIQANRSLWPANTIIQSYEQAMLEFRGNI